MFFFLVDNTTNLPLMQRDRLAFGWISCHKWNKKFHFFWDQNFGLSVWLSTKRIPCCTSI